jgi:hypothetical protein
MWRGAFFSSSAWCDVFFFPGMCYFTKVCVCIGVVVGSTNYQYTVGTLSVCWRDTDTEHGRGAWCVSRSRYLFSLSPLRNVYVYNGNGEV